MIDTIIKIKGKEIRYKWISYIDIDDKRHSDWNHCEKCEHCGREIVHVVYWNGLPYGRDCLYVVIGVDTVKRCKKAIDEAMIELKKREREKYYEAYDRYKRHLHRIEILNNSNVPEKVKKEAYDLMNKWKENARQLKAAYYKKWKQII